MANFNFASKMIGGRITSSPELRSTNDGTMCTDFTIAVKFNGRDKTQKTDFFSCVAWGNTADFVVKFFRKGSSIFVVGTPHNKTWTDSNGIERTREELTVSEVRFVDSKDETPAVVMTPAPSPKPAAAPVYEQLNLDDENLPF